MKNDLDYAARYAASVLSRHIALNKHSLGCAVAVAQLKDAVDLELTDEELAEINVEYICPECEHEWNEDRTDEEASTCPECETEDVDADCWDYL